MLKKYKSTKIFSVVFHRVHVQQTAKAEKLNSSPVLSFFVLWREKKHKKEAKLKSCYSSFW